MRTVLAKGKAGKADQRQNGAGLDKAGEAGGRLGHVIRLLMEIRVVGWERGSLG
jgi:hypothetical protein